MSAPSVDLASRLGVVASAAAIVEAIRASAPEVARDDDADDDTPDDDDTLGRVLPERARAHAAVCEALDLESDHVLATLCLDHARDAWQRACEDYEARESDPLYRALLARASDRFERWLAVREVLTAATRAESVEHARRRAVVPRG